MKFKTVFQHKKISDYLFPFLLAVLCSVIFYNNYFTDLDKVNNGIIGIATYDGVDVGKRIIRFYGAGACLIIAFPFFSFLLNYSSNKFKYSFKESTYINTLSFLSLIIISVTILVKNDWAEISTIFSSITIVTFFSFTLYKIFKVKSRINWNKIGLSISLSFICLTFLVDLAHFYGTGILKSNYQAITILIYFLFLFLFQFINNYFFRRIFNAVLPMAIIPLLYTFTNEIYFVFDKHNAHISSLTLYLILLLILVIFSLLSFFLIKTINNQKTLRRFGVLMIIAVVVSAQYQLYITDWKVENFELANQANAMMNVFKFHQIPIIDFFNSHLFYEQFPGLVYFLIHGYNGSLDFLVYGFLIPLINYVLVYYFLILIFKRVWIVTFFILFLPFLPDIIFPLNYSSILLCFIALYHFVKTEKLKDFILLIATLIFSMIWRIDNAVIALPAVVVCLSFWIYQTKKLSQVLKHAFLTTLGLGVLIIIVTKILLWQNHTIVNNLKNALEYIGASEAHGYSDIQLGSNFQINTAYFLMPVLSIFLCLISLLFYFQKRIKLFEILVILFFTIVYLLNFQRGLVRHTIGNEGTDKYFIAYIYFLIPYSILVLSKIRKYRSWIFSLMAFFFMMAFKSPHPRESNIIISQALSTIVNRNFANENDINQPRVTTYNEHKLKEAAFMEFMNKNFTKDASFIDMSNNPLLYFITQRPIPGYFCQYLQNMVTAPTQERNVLVLKNKNLPIVIFSAYPQHEFLDRIDGVENTIRYHKIANYVFNNYRPLGVIDEKYIWLKNGITNLKYNNAVKLSDSIIYAPQNFNIQKLSYYWAKGHSSKTKPVLLNLISTSQYALPQNISKQNGNYLIVTIENNSGVDQSFKTNYTIEDKMLGGFECWVSKEKTGDYLIPLSTQYNWYAFLPNQIRFLNPNRGLTIKSVSLFEGL